MTGMELEGRPMGTRPEANQLYTTMTGDDGGCLMVGLSGELDVSCTDALVDLVVQLCTDGQRTLIMDLAGLQFVDIAGLRALLSARRVATGCGARLTITGARPLARRLLALTGFDAELGVR